jgi:hypothetical protein
MSTDSNSVVHETDAPKPGEEITVTLDASLEAFGEADWDDFDATPHVERIVLEPGAPGDDVAALGIEGRLEDVDVGSVVELVVEDHLAERVVLDAHSESEREVSVSFEGRFEEDASLLDAVSPDDTDVDRLSFDFRRGDDAEIGFSLRGRVDDPDVVPDREDGSVGRVVVEPGSE